MPRRKPKYDPHDYGAIRGVWETLADVKVRYSADETGWAKQLSAGTVCIANLPMADELMFLDICSCADLDGRSGEDLPEVGCVLKAYYAQRAGVRYSVADEGGADLPRRYQAFARAIECQDCAIEGLVSGLCQVQARADCDMQAVVAAAAGAAGLVVEPFDVHRRELPAD